MEAGDLAGSSLLEELQFEWPWGDDVVLMDGHGLGEGWCWIGTKE